MNIPKLVKIRQFFNDQHIINIEDKVKEEILNSGIEIKKGASIAIAVGSRGIANIDEIVKATVQWVKDMGGYPFIVPAMGSHGGATAKGQKEVLEGYGITEESVGAPIKSSMEVVELPKDELPNNVYMDKNAYQAEGTIIINRIKVHTDFHGRLESGLMKMCVIGLGKHKQALKIHNFGVYGLKELIVPTARQVLKHGNIIMGIGIVENAYDQTAIIRALRPTEIEEEEVKLLEQSRGNMPSLPVDKLDVLIIDEMGKNISGVGADTNIIGRIGIKGETEPERPNITSIIIRDLTAVSHGNAIGVGLADIITKKLYDKIDFRTTYENVITSTFLQRGNIPIIADTDRQAIEYAFRTCGPINFEEARIARIKNTLNLDEIYVSKSVLDDINYRDKIQEIGGFKDLINDGNEFIDF